MMVVKFFESVGDLMELTGLTREELWQNGFNLDDMDFGIVCENELVDGYWSGGAPYYIHWLLQAMDSHCVGYHHTEYDSKHYYTVHHS